MIEIINKNRAYLMGIAILLVVMYHAFCWIYNPLGSLNIGYVGVDIFLFLSGLGLANSFEKNKISRFYKNRFVRIYPIYFLAVVTTYLIFCHKVWDIDDLLYNLSFLGFYTKGATQRYDWYLESLFTLYLLFPIFYYFSKLRYISLLLLFISTTLILKKFDISWWYGCFIGRLPIFLYGIMFSKCHKSAKYIGILGVIFYIPCRLFVSPYLASSFLTITIIFISLLLLRKLKSPVKNVIDFFGKHTLEIYITNLFIFWSIQIYTFNITEKLVLYIFVQTIGTYLVIKANQFITMYIWNK